MKKRAVGEIISSAKVHYFDVGFKKGFNTKAKEEAKILLYLARESTQSGLEKLIASELVREWE